MNTRPFSHIAPEVRARLLDAGTVERAYRHNSIKQAATMLGTSQHVFERALDLHGVDRRKRGAPIPSLELERDTVRLATLRAYLRVNDAGCPPGCPGRSRCLDGDCILGELCR